MCQHCLKSKYLWRYLYPSLFQFLTMISAESHYLNNHQLSFLEVLSKIIKLGLEHTVLIGPSSSQANYIINNTRGALTRPASCQ